jgi:hypothetical protein
VFKMLLGKPVTKISLQRHMRRPQESTEMHLREVDCEGVDILRQVQDRIQ